MERRNRGQSWGPFINTCIRISINVGHTVGKVKRGIWPFLARWGWTSWRQVYLSTPSSRPMPL